MESILLTTTAYQLLSIITELIPSSYETQTSSIQTLMSLVAHRFGLVEFPIFVLIFSTALACRKKQIPYAMACTFFTPFFTAVYIVERLVLKTIYILKMEILQFFGL